MILKVDGLTTGQFRDLAMYLTGPNNEVRLGEARKLGFHDDATVEEVTRDQFSRPAGMSPDLHNVIRIVSVKGKLTPGHTQKEEDCYDIVLDVPQAMFLQQVAATGKQKPKPRIVSIPPRILGAVMEILADNPMFQGTE